MIENIKKVIKILSYVVVLVDVLKYTVKILEAQESNSTNGENVSK